jgi:hypothetical protein
LFSKGTPAIHWNPMNGPGPLRLTDALSFRSATYLEHNLKESTIFHRSYSNPPNALGSYWSRNKPSGPLQSIMDNALDRSWGNQATQVISIRVPPGQRIYEGISAPQQGLLGGGNQVFIQNVNPSWVIK